MKVFLVVIAFLLTIGAQSLYFQTHQTPQTYLSQLKQQQDTINTIISNLKTSYSQTQLKLNTENNILEKIRILEQTILKQKTQLSALSKATLIPLNESDWVCQKLQGTTQSQLLSLSQNIVNQTNNLNNAINNVQNKTTSNYLNTDSSSAIKTAQQIQKMVSSTGTLQDSITKQKATNWLATNWVSGNKTKQQIQELTKTLTDNTDLLLPCPRQTPFYDGSRCKACISPIPYFNVETKQCVACQIYDEATHKCKTSTPPTPTPQYNGTNFKSGLGRIVFPPDTNVQALKNQTATTCPDSAPFYTNDNGCIQCSGNATLFNYQNQECTTCGVNETYVPEKYACVGQKIVTVTNLPVSSNRLILPEGVTIQKLQQEQQDLAKNSNVAFCPSDKPFYNNNQCINCENNTFYFNLETLKCQNCSEGFNYDNSTHKCSKIVYYSNLVNGNWTSLNPKAIIQDQLASKQISGATPCPTNTPFYNGTNCIGCPSNQNYNFDAKVCQACPLGNIFNINLHSCIKSQQGLFQTNPNASKLIYGGFPKNQWQTQYNNNKIKYPTIQDCPVPNPYFDGSVCINCNYQKFPYFNLVEKECANCDPGLNQTYVEQKKQCQINQTIVTQYPTIQKMLASIFT